jgi:hypothetical protein
MNIYNLEKQRHLNRLEKFNSVKRPKRKKYKDDNKFTRMCWNCNCENPNCTYAHTISELRIVGCKYGKCCNLVRFEKLTKKYENIQKRKCYFIHPGEKEEEYIERLNIKNIKDKDPLRKEDFWEKIYNTEKKKLSGLKKQNYEFEKIIIN